MWKCFSTPPMSFSMSWEIHVTLSVLVTGGCANTFRFTSCSLRRERESVSPRSTACYSLVAALGYQIQWPHLLRHDNGFQQSLRLRSWRHGKLTPTSRLASEDTENHDPNDGDDSEVVFNGYADRRRSRERIYIPRTDLNNLFDEIRQLGNEVDRMRDKTRRQRPHGDSSGDVEQDFKNETVNNRRARIKTLMGNLTEIPLK